MTTGVPEAPADCALCPRLVDFRNSCARSNPGWHNAPVSSFGDPDARLLIVGLAPGLQGANRTGRPFTGDHAGELLYATLAKFGWTRGTYQASPEDGLQLVGAIISNAVRCVPPENKPTGAEILNCRTYLVGRIHALPRLQAIIALGRIAHDSTVRALGERPQSLVFGHGRRRQLQGPYGPVVLHDSYHCSRYNTQTGRLTEDMFHAVFAAAAEDLAVPLA